MDKKLLIQQAEQYIPKDLLYGSYKGIVFKDFIETNADRIVVPDDNEDIISSRLIDTIERVKEDGLFTEASKSVRALVNPNMSAREIIDNFIRSIPYKNDINTTSENSINIEHELRNYEFQMNEDYTFGPFHKTLDDIYRLLITNEYIRPTKTSKLEQMIRIMDDLIDLYKSDYEEIAKTSINGVTFEKMLVTLPNRINDDFKVEENGTTYELDDYIKRKYREYSEVRYNSVNSKPQNVEQIGLVSNGNNIEVTNEYIFLNPSEVDQLTKKNDYSASNIIENDLRTIIKGVQLAKSLDTLHSYDDRISSIRDSIGNSFSDNSLIKELYLSLAINYAKQENQLELYEENREDMEVLLRNELLEIKEEINNIKKDYLRTYENIDERILNIKNEFINFKRKVEQMGLTMHHELDDVNRILKGLEMVYQYSRGNISHDREREVADIAYLDSQISSLERKESVSPTERAADLVRLDALRLERDKKKNEYGIQDSGISRAA